MTDAPIRTCAGCGRKAPQRSLVRFAAQNGVATPLFNASAVVYNAAMAQGFAKQDTAAVCTVLERLSGVRRK